MATKTFRIYALFMGRDELDQFVIGLRKYTSTHPTFELEESLWHNQMDFFFPLAGQQKIESPAPIQTVCGIVNFAIAAAPMNEPYVRYGMHAAVKDDAAGDAAFYAGMQGVLIGRRSLRVDVDTVDCRLYQVQFVQADGAGARFNVWLPATDVILF